MGLGPILAVASLAMTAIGTAASISANNRAAQADYSAAQRNTQFEYDAAAQELQFRQKETQAQRQEANEASVQQKSDRMRKAVYDLGALQVATGEGGLASSTAFRIEQEAAFAAGVDLGRIEGTRRNQMRAYDTQLEGARIDYENRTKAAQIGAQSRVESAYEQNQARNTSAVLGGFSSALQIGAGRTATTRPTSIATSRRVSTRRRPTPLFSASRRQ